MKKAPEVKCPSCKGRGTVELSGTLTATLKHFGAKSKLTATEIADGISPNAVNNRLEKLRTMGILERERDGRYWRYFRAAWTPVAAEPAPSSTPDRAPVKPAKATKPKAPAKKKPAGKHKK